MTYSKKINYPSFKKPGVYPSGSLKELGLDNDNLEKFSLGNWNSIIGKSRVFALDIAGILTTSPNPKGRPVYMGFGQGTLNLGLRRIMYTKEGGNIIPDSITEVMNADLNSVDNIPNIVFEGFGDPPATRGDEIESDENRSRHFDVWGYYYSGANEENGSWNNREFREERRLPLNTTLAFIKSRDSEDVSAPLVFEFDEGGDMGLTYEREVNQEIFEDSDFTHELFFPRALKFKNPLDLTIDAVDLFSITNVPQLSDSGFFELNIQDELVDPDEFLIRLGAPSFTYNFFLDDQEFINTISPDTELFLVNTTTQNENEFLYYDDVVNEFSYNDTSYPVEVTFDLKLYDYPDFENEIVSEDTNSLLDLFYLDETEVTQFIDSSSFDIENSYFTYQVIQWGDEKNLLSDEQIKNTYFFNLYDVEEYPESDNYFLKKWFTSQTREAIPIQDSVSHVYNTPGVKSIKIVVYRYDKSKLFLIQTYLVTKNIVVNDGTLSSQDFSIFGGTDFNFLPIVNNQAIIGGFDENSKYDNSVSQIVKDDNFIQEDYLERVSSKDYIRKFNNGLLGKSPQQLDLSTTRIFRKPFDIYDFITDDKQSIVDNNFNIDTLPINSSATDIFISDEDCTVELNMNDLDYLSIQNTRGNGDKAILIGDYKINQPKDGAVQRQGVMETPLLDDREETQAF